MLSFELSAIDLILVIAVIILLILYITKLSTKFNDEQRLLVDKRDIPEKPAAKVEPFKARGETRSPIQFQKNFSKCPHYFGYLKRHAKNTSIPDECLNCPRIVECLHPNE